MGSSPIFRTEFYHKSSAFVRWLFSFSTEFSDPWTANHLYNGHSHKSIILIMLIINSKTYLLPGQLLADWICELAEAAVGTLTKAFSSRTAMQSLSRYSQRAITPQNNGGGWPVRGRLARWAAYLGVYFISHRILMPFLFRGCLWPHYGRGHGEFRMLGRPIPLRQEESFHLLPWHVRSSCRSAWCFLRGLWYKFSRMTRLSAQAG